MLREAAEIRGWSVAQLIRIAAYEKAVQIVNSNSPAITAICNLVSELIKQLRKPRLLECSNGVALAKGGGRLDPPMEFDQAKYDLGEKLVFASSLDAAKIRQLVDAIRRLGSEITPVIERELDRFDSADKCVGTLIDPADPTE